MNDLPRQKLSRLIGQYGFSLCDAPRRCEGLLRDLCGEYKREINLLISAMKEQVPANLLSSKGSTPWELLLNRLTRRLHDNLGLTEEGANWAVESWALALGVIDADEITQPQQEAAAGAQPGAAPQASSWGKPQIQMRQKKWVIGGALLVCLAIGVGVLLNTRKPQQISTPPPPAVTPVPPPAMVLPKEKPPEPSPTVVAPHRPAALAPEPAPPAKANLKEQLQKELSILSEAQLRKDIVQFMRVFSLTYPELDNKRASTLKSWEGYDFTNLVSTIDKIQEIDPDNAIAWVTWYIDTKNRRTQDLSSSSQTFQVRFAKEMGKWRIRSVEEVE